MGLSPMQSLSGGIYNINGKFEISARLLNQLIRRNRHQLKVLSNTDEVCTIWGKRRDTGEELTHSFHIQEAARAGLIKEGGPWKKYPKDMCFARAISRLARQLFPDCIGSCYVEGELDDKRLCESQEAPSLPEPEEMSIEEEKMTVAHLSLPENVDKELLGYYISEIATQCKIPESQVLSEASERMQGFLESFEIWQKKHFTQAAV